MEPHTGLNNLDYIVLGIVLLSAIFALFRGFLRELFSLIAWAAGYLAAIKYHALLEPFVHRYIKSEALISPIASVGVFLIAFIAVSIVGAIVVRFVRSGGLTAIDRSLGFLFGIFRGVLIVCIIYMAASTILWPELDKPPEQQTAQSDEDKSPNKPPEWLVEAKTRPALAYGSKILVKFIPKEELEKTTKSAQQYVDQELARQKGEAQKAAAQQELDRLSTPTPAAPQQATAPTYDNKSRDGINQLINQKGTP